MELPPEIVNIIRDYSKPIGLRLDWRQGCYYNRHVNKNLMYYCYGTHTYTEIIETLKKIHDFKLRFHSNVDGSPTFYNLI